MNERWRRPLVVLDTEPGDEVIITSDGRIQRTLKVIYDRESTERIRLGYACAVCQEVWERAWPEQCPSCKRPIRARQREYFEREFAGEVQLGSRVSIKDELARLREYEEEK